MGESIRFTLPRISTNTRWEPLFETSGMAGRVMHLAGGRRYQVHGRSMAAFRVWKQEFQSY
jgi:hypothetical protein